MKHFTGTLSMMRFILKRDKITLLCWIIILPLLPYLSITALAKLYPDTASLQFFVDTVNADPLQLNILGPVLAPTLGAAMCWKWLNQSAIFLGIFNLFFVIKHTRSEEASGRYELLSATAIGRYAMLTATLSIASLANGLIGIGIFVSLWQYGLPFAGSLSVGLAAWLIGTLMAAFSALCAQFTQEAGTAKGMTGIVIAIFYTIKTISNSAFPSLSWISPIGWLYKMRPYADENWYPILPFIMTIIAVTAVSYLLLSKRDIGTGFFQQRHTKISTSPSLNNVFALAWRLHRKMIFSWSFCFAIMGSILGAMMHTITIQMGKNEQFKAFLYKMGGTDLGDLIFTLMILFLGQTFAVYAIMTTQKMQVEEMENRSDIVFSTAVSRYQWVLSHLAIILIGLTSMLFTYGASSGLFYGIANNNILHETLRLTAASFAILPALCIMAGFAFLIFALFPKRFYLSWLLLIFVVSLDFIRELVPNAETIAKFSPFTHVPKVLLGEAAWGNLFWLSLVAVGLVLIGIFYYRERDMV